MKIEIKQYKEYKNGFRISLAKYNKMLVIIGQSKNIFVRKVQR